jgi:starch synthase
MQPLTRVLFVVSEAEPFTDTTDLARLARVLPEKLQETGRFELRIMMPRYGIISERRNRLHEVIRLSGAELAVGAGKETLKVKVASIPGLRLQVYFMENNRFFKRKGGFLGRDGEEYADNAERSLFFGRAALTTIHNLGWAPDLVHAVGWAGAFRSIYTPDGYDARTTFDPALLAQHGVSPDEGNAETLRDLAERCADAVLNVPEETADTAELATRMMVRYDEVLGSVAV